MKRRSFLAAALVVASLGCGGGKQYWHAQPVNTAGIRILPQKVTVWGKLLYVDTEIWNDSAVPVMVDRDRVTLVLPNGSSVGRSQGTWTQHKGYVLPPGGRRAVNVDFKADGFKWSEVGNAQVEFSQAVLIEGNPVMLPRMPVSKYPLAQQPVAPPPAATAPPASAPPAGPAPAPNDGSNGGGGIDIKGSVEVKSR